MEAICNGCYSYSSSIFMSPLDKDSIFKSKNSSLTLFSNSSTKRTKITSKYQDARVEMPGPGANKRGLGNSKNKMDEYNIAMKRLMRNPYEYHHDLGMNYTLITDNLIVGSQPQKPEDIDHLKQEENVAYILNLQQDRDIEYWGIDFESILRRCQKLDIQHMRKPARDFDPDSLRNGLPKAVSSLEWAISDGKGRAYVHCTAGLGRAPAVAIAYLYWFCDMNLNTAYDMLTSKRPCGPNRKSIRGATYDLVKSEPWKEPFDDLPDHAFEDIADWERKLIQDRVRCLHDE